MSKQTNGVEQPKREFAVRVPKGSPRKLTIMKFNGSLNIRPENWAQETVRLEREDNRRHGVTTAGEVVQEFGEGSVFGSAAREEARRKKLGRQARKYNHDNQPWRLAIERSADGEGAAAAEAPKTGGGKTRKFRSIREAGAGEHADYWIFYRVGNDLEAYKVDEWYQFLPAVTYKYLDAEQAEERFQQQSKVFNQFALKAQIQRQLAEQEEREQQGQMLAKNASGLKIKDEASSDDEYEADDEVEPKNGQNDGAKVRRKGKATAKNTKAKGQAKGDKKKQRVEAGDEVAAYESEDGEDEGREYDYMSDSGSDTDREELNADKKMEEDLVGVGEEKGLKRSLESDEEGEEEEEEEESEAEEAKESDGGPTEEQRTDGGESRQVGKGAKAVKNVDTIMAQRGGNRIAVEVCVEKDESNGSETDEDPDKEAIKSVLFMQDRRKKTGQSNNSEQSRKRHAAEAENGTEKAIVGAKKPKVIEQRETNEKAMEDDDSDIINGEISETFVRRLLERKPHSTKQLLTKANQRLQQKLMESGTQQQQHTKDKRIVTRLADILKKIEPYQFRKTNEAGKEVLFFSLNRTA
ncbi:hypothetical protein niasHT_022584 [Heterodera trifolii]|uniref:Transcription initiation factor IIF subunit alpha n=1 Tax=Heterodera trifolii TaxID=157864 RepID=A0ABD2JR83_9BILA